MSLPAAVPVPSLSLNVYTEENATVVECSGRLSLEVTAVLKERVKNLIPCAQRIILDLSGLTYMDSSGLGTVVGLYVSAKARNCDLRLINLNRQIREMLRLTNLLTLFECCGRYPMKFP